MRTNGQIITAFAAQTGDEGVELAREKISKKGADLLYFNDVSGGAIFGESSTTGVILERGGESENVSRIDKGELAHKLLDRAVNKLSFSNE